jgi:membrane associated rhomboid family serine protease
MIIKISMTWDYNIDFSKEPDDIFDEPTVGFLSKKPDLNAFFTPILYAFICLGISVYYWITPTAKTLLAGNKSSIFFNHEYYKLITTILLHSNFAHFFSNMIYLVMFGGLLAFYYGLFVFPFAAFFLGVVTHGIALYTYPEYTNLIGSSGIVFILYGMWITLYLRVETHLTLAKRYFRVFGFSLLMFIPSKYSPGTSYRTHYIGLFLGIMFGIIYGMIKKDFFEKKNRKYRKKHEIIKK